MARICGICQNQLAGFVREKYKQYPTQPAAVLNAIEKKTGLRFTYTQLKNHRAMHDPLSGTLIQVGRSLDKKNKEADELVTTGRALVRNLEGLLVKGTDLNELNWEEFKALPITKQVKLQLELHKLAIAVKDLEMKQEKMSKERNVMLGRMNSIAANTFKSKPRVDAKTAT